MTKSTRHPLARLVGRLVRPARPAAPAPQPEEEELEPTVKMSRQFIKYGD